MLLAQRAQLAQIGHAHWLAACHVHRAGEAHVGHLLGPNSGDQRRQLVQIDVSLEWVLARRVVGFRDDDVDKGAAGKLLVQTGGSEVHVAGDVVAVLDDRLAEQVFGAATLVRGNDVAIAVVGAHRLLETIEVAAAGVRLVAHHHSRPLPIVHRAGATVGE